MEHALASVLPFPGPVISPVNGSRTTVGGAQPDALEAVIRDLALHSQPHAHCEQAEVLRARAGSLPIAAVIRQAATLRSDLGAIRALKEWDRHLPILYLARSSSPRRETAVRRLGIHYFVSHPVEREELRLVIEVLARAAGSRSFSHTLERFFTR